MHFIIKVKTHNGEKESVNSFLIEAENFIHAETVATRLFGDLNGFMAIDNIVKQNIKKIFLNEGSEYFWAVKIEFAFIDAKAVKELYVVQANKLDHALSFINASIEATEVAMATVIEIKRFDVKDAYTQKRLEEEENIISDKRLEEKAYELMNAIDKL